MFFAVSSAYLPLLESKEFFVQKTRSKQTLTPVGFLTVLEGTQAHHQFTSLVLWSANRCLPSQQAACRCRRDMLRKTWIYHRSLGCQLYSALRNEVSATITETLRMSSRFLKLAKAPSSLVRAWPSLSLDTALSSTDHSRVRRLTGSSEMSTKYAINTFKIFYILFRLRPASSDGLLCRSRSVDSLCVKSCVFSHFFEL